MDRHLGPARKVPAPARVVLGQRQRHVAGDVGDAQEVERFGRPHRHQYGDRVVLSGAVVDDRRARGHDASACVVPVYSSIPFTSPSPGTASSPPAATAWSVIGARIRIPATTVSNARSHRRRRSVRHRYAGVRLPMDRLGVERVDRIRPAEAFGNHIDVKYAMVLGLVPDCALERVTSAGNAAGTGARTALPESPGPHGCTGLRGRTRTIFRRPSWTCTIIFNVCHRPRAVRKEAR